MKLIKIITLGLIISLATGCASYRTNSNLTFDSKTVETRTAKVEILEEELSEGSYESLGAVEAVVKKLTIFHKSPTKEQVNYVLTEKALELNADAVINVTYESGVGMTTWGYMKGKGIAVKKRNSE